MRPIRIVLGWQVVVTAVLALAFAYVWGPNGALSAALGGAVNIVAGVAYALMASRSGRGSMGEALRGILRAEAVKIMLILVQLPLVLSLYKNIVHGAFFTAFVITVLVFAAAIAIRGDEQQAPR
ncbi:MAG: ATP synthase subunit I [Bacillota bacterium]